MVAKDIVYPIKESIVVFVLLADVEDIETLFHNMIDHDIQ